MSSSPCAAHQWNHATEPCPYCRETGATARHSASPAVRSAEAMSPDDIRAERLSQAIVAAISGDVNGLKELFTHDVVGSGPALSVSDRAELTVEVGSRDNLTDVEIALAALDVAGDQACVEWVVSGERPSGRPGGRVRVRAITVAEFDGDQICSFRSYWDDTTMLDEIGTGKIR